MRYRIVGRSDLVAPACCFFYRTDTEEYYIDTGKTLDWEGAVYIGARALQEIAELAGYLAPDKVQQLVAENKELTDALVDCRTKLDDYNRMFSPVLDHFAKQQGLAGDVEISAPTGAKSSVRSSKSNPVVVVADVPANSTGLDL